jgi:outer membrane lipoprotein-sorting protein
MKRCFVVLSLLAAFLLVSAPAQALPTADEVLKMIVDKTGKTKTMQGDATSETRTPNGVMKSAGHVVASITGDDKNAVRKFLMTTKMSMQQGETAVTQNIKTVSNGGEFVWIEIRNSVTSDVQVLKMKTSVFKAAQGDAVTPAEQAALLGKMFDLGAVSEETIDGKKMFVLEGTPKTDTPQAKQMAAVMSKGRYYVDQNSLAFRRMVMLDLAGNELIRTEMLNTKFDEPVDPKLFDYTPPAGAQIKEMNQPPATPAPDAPAKE